MVKVGPIKKFLQPAVMSAPSASSPKKAAAPHLDRIAFRVISTILVARCDPCLAEPSSCAANFGNRENVGDSLWRGGAFRGDRSHLTQLDRVARAGIDLPQIDRVDLHSANEMRCDEEDDLFMLQLAILRAE